MTTLSTPTRSEQRYYYGTGKRKNAIAQVRLYPEGDEVVVNGRSLEQALPWVTWQTAALEPLLVTDTLGKFTVVAKLQGGGTSAWGDALRHGISRALLVFDPELRKVLRSHGMLTRDARIKERKKYGLKRARRAPQYTKR
ncbi:MAG: 30S ribosomal protein S9 [Chloroflexota bacterium]|nr:30S ribosomal protein S9 [Chloroflexota bacterium]